MSITRRQALQFGGIAAASALAYGGYRLGCDYTDLFVDHLYPFVKPTERWGAQELSGFLEHLRSAEQNLILGSVRTPTETFDPDKVKAQVRWLASNVATYPFRDKTNYNYHEEILQWLATEFKVEQSYRAGAPSFVLERKILDSMFVQLWDKLAPDQRRQILDKIDAKGGIQDKAGMALAGGAVALAGLSTTVCFTGFAFYVSMSTTICAAAGFFGVTLPFAAYMGASAAVAVLAGPVGWAIAGMAALGSVVFLGRADPAKTAAFVTQLHLLKVQSLKNSRRLDRVLQELALK